MYRYVCFLLVFALTHVCATVLPARIINVPGSAATIQTGIYKTEEGDTVMVAPGTYYEHDIDFSGKAITVMSTDPDDFGIVSSTVVDADSLGSVFCFQSEEGAGSVLAGFTITGGWSEFWGGGIYCSGSSPTITRNVIEGNYAGWGGGGIRCSHSSPTISYNIIRGNESDYGGGIDCHYGANPVISHNLVSDNESNTGGGIYGYSYSYPEIVDNTITGNRAEYGAGLHFRYDCKPILSNNTVTGNSAEYNGGGMRLMYSCSAVVTSTIFWNNTAELGEEIYIGGADEPSELEITYSNVRGGLATVYSDSSSTVEWGPGFIDADPYFTDPGGGDYRLLTDSPCIDAGDPESRIPPNGGDRIDIGACEYRYMADPPVRFTFPDPPERCWLGEMITWAYTVKNVDGDYVVYDWWLEVSGPRNMLLGSMTGLVLPPYSSRTGTVDVYIPDYMIEGIYTVKGRAGVIHKEIWDGEVFETEMVDRIEPDADLSDQSSYWWFYPESPEPLPPR